MSRGSKSIVYEKDDLKLRGKDLKVYPRELAEDFLTEARLWFLFDRLPGRVPASTDTLIGWVDDATGGLYGLLREKISTYARFYVTYPGYDTVTFRFEDPTVSTLFGGLMRGKQVALALKDVLPPPVPTMPRCQLLVPSSWTRDAEVRAWVRRVLKAQADKARLINVVATAVERTRLRPWTVLAAFSPAFAGWWGASFKPTFEMLRAIKEEDTVFVRDLIPELVLRAKADDDPNQAFWVTDKEGQRL
jgi:hypothetical protein